MRFSPPVYCRAPPPTPAAGPGAELGRDMGGTRTPKGSFIGAPQHSPLPRLPRAPLCTA